MDAGLREATAAARDVVAEEQKKANDLLHEVAKNPPIHSDSDWGPLCAWCKEEERGTDFPLSDPKNHSPTCLWRQIKELVTDWARR